MERIDELYAMDQDQLVKLVLELEAKKSKGPRIKNVEYSVKDLGEGTGFSKLPPQAKTVLGWIQDEGPVSEEKLREIAAQRAEELKTKQDPWRIFQYYRPRLINEDFLLVTDIAVNK